MTVIFKKAIKKKSKPLKRGYYFLHQLADYLNISKAQVLIMVEQGIGPQPVGLVGKYPYCFTSDCVEMWLGLGKPDKLIEAPVLKDSWMIREWGKDKKMRMEDGGPEELPEGFKFQDFSI